MKKLKLIAALIVLSQAVFAGGLLTNYNQSAKYVRMLSRNASLDIDAVYFNPAGLVKLDDGWHFSLSNQSIFQSRTVTSGFPLLNNGVYEGEIEAPLFPSFYAVYKQDKLALSFGFGPVSGGGSAVYDRGLPSFEISLSKLVPGLQVLQPLGYNVTGYNANLYFDGSSNWLGYQLGLSYALNDQFSVFGGARLSPATNEYYGYIKQIEVEVNQQMQSAQTVLGTASSTLAAQAGQLSGIATGSLQQLIAGGAGDFTLTQVLGAGYIDDATKMQLEATLSSLGLSSEQIAGATVSVIQATFQGASGQFTTQATALQATADGLGDKEVDTKQKGLGVTPIIGVNYSPSEKVNIGIKYEHKTNLSLENETVVDDLGLFPDGQSVQSDIPAILAVGLGVNPVDWLEAQLSYNLYFDKGVDWGLNVRDLAIWQDVDPAQIRTREIDNNYYEIALGLQFNLSEQFAVSVGGLRSKSGIADSWQSDFSFSNPSATLGFGIEWKITDQLVLDAGFLNTFYEKMEHSYVDPDIGTYNESFEKSVIDFAVGISYSIF